MLFALSALARVLLVGGRGAGGEPQVLVRTTTATSTPAATGTPTRYDATLRDLSGFAVPVKGACLPDLDTLMPNAPRPYREGVHEGVDFYNGHVCVPVAKDMEALAARDGLVIRADIDYQPLTRAEADKPASDPASLDRLRGRQVWIDHGADEHGNRIITRYAHLDGVAPGIRVGTKVRAGQVVAFVGNSGTPESLDDSQAEIHLHFELRVGDGFLGQGLGPAAVRDLYRRLFS